MAGKIAVGGKSLPAAGPNFPGEPQGERGGQRKAHFLLLLFVSFHFACA